METMRQIPSRYKMTDGVKTEWVDFFRWQQARQYAREQAELWSEFRALAEDDPKWETFNARREAMNAPWRANGFFQAVEYRISMQGGWLFSGTEEPQTSGSERIGNSEIITSVDGKMGAVITTDPSQVAVSCYVDWTGDKVFIRRKVFRTRRGALLCATRFFGGVR